MALSTLKGVYPYNGLDEYMELTPVRVYMSGKKNAGKYALVSAGDLGKVIGHRWYIWSNYANSSNGPGMMHVHVMGERPDDIHEDWVIDHINRNTLDNRRDNLRWTSSSWNNWNKDIIGVSKYKGVMEGPKGKWIARFLKQALGQYDDERTAGWVVARAAIATFQWAETCDIITRNFSPEEIQLMKKEGYIPRPPRTLPKGVSWSKPKKMYVAHHFGKILGFFPEVVDARKAYLDSVQNHYDTEWAKHIKTPITYDKEGHAIIMLTGTNPILYTKVPKRFWYILTFNHKWHLSTCYARGTWEGKATLLHTVVWRLLHPSYVKAKGDSIDHINPYAPLDNREENLRIGDKSLQGRNKRKTGFGRYPGVSFNPHNNNWCGSISVNGVTYRTKAVKNENEAARLLNALRIKVLGPNADLNVIIED